MHSTKTTASPERELKRAYHSLQDTLDTADLEQRALQLSAAIKRISLDPVEYARNAPLLTQLHADLEHAIHSLVHYAQHDPLTGARNRSTHLEDGTRQLDLTRRLGGHLHYILVDVDRFKQVNDTYGHPTGDAILVAFVRAARQTLRSADSIYRLGGDEFCILTPSIGDESAQEEADRLIGRIDTRYRTLLKEEDLPIATISFAYASYDHDVKHLPQDIGADALLSYLHKLTDQRLYAAKAQGSVVGYVH
jgi:diguanylate cyclase (GGDEF)-like protein